MRWKKAELIDGWVFLNREESYAGSEIQERFEEQ